MEKASVPKPRVNILTVKVRYPKLGVKTENFWQKVTAEYFEGEIIFEGFY